jgi:hypothetical protein
VRRAASARHAIAARTTTTPIAIKTQPHAGMFVPPYLEAATAERAQQKQHEHDDHDDPENGHSTSFRIPDYNVASSRGGTTCVTV